MLTTTIPQEALLKTPDDIMEAVTAFLGLDPIDWTQVTVQGESHALNGPTPEEAIPLSASTLQRLRAFLDLHGTSEWDYVRQHGHRDCQPDISALDAPQT